MKRSTLWIAGLSLGLLASITAQASAAPGWWRPAKKSYSGPAGPKAPGGGATRGAGGAAAPGPATPGGKAATTPMGIPMTPRERGQSAKSVLKLAWDYPSYTQEVKPTTGSVAKQARRALSKEDAFLYVAGNDPRPLLVLRECKTCNGTDDALLSKGSDNERTFLLSTWFHCVKMPVDVLTPEHPFYEMFNHEDPEHLFVASRDGMQKVLLQSDTSRTELWDAMGKVLTASYSKDPQPVVKQVQKSLDRLDVLDERLLDLRSKKGELFETEGADSPKLRKINLEIDQTQKEIASILDEVAKTAKLDLKPNQASPVGSGSAKAGR